MRGLHFLELQSVVHVGNGVLALPRHDGQILDGDYDCVDRFDRPTPLHTNVNPYVSAPRRFDPAYVCREYFGAGHLQHRQRVRISRRAHSIPIPSPSPQILIDYQMRSQQCVAHADTLSLCAACMGIKLEVSRCETSAGTSLRIPHDRDHHLHENDHDRCVHGYRNQQDRRAGHLLCSAAKMARTLPLRPTLYEVHRSNRACKPKPMREPGSGSNAATARHPIHESRGGVEGHAGSEKQYGWRNTKDATRSRRSRAWVTAPAGIKPGPRDLHLIPRGMFDHARVRQSPPMAHTLAGEATHYRCLPGLFLISRG